MKFSKSFRLCLLVLSLLPVWPLSAQGPVCRYEAVCTAGFRYVADSSSEYFNNYQVLRELAREHLVEVPYVKLLFAARSKFEVTRNGDGQTLLSVGLGDTRASGHTTFRGFDISGYLLPSVGNSDVIHRNKADTSLSCTYSFRDVYFDPLETVFPVILLPGYDPGADTLLVRVSGLRFSGSDLSLLQERINLINDYFASASMLDTLLAYGNRYSSDSLPAMPFTFCNILELTRITGLVIARDFGGTLLLNGPDPRDLMKKQQEALRLSRTVTYNFMDRLERSGRIIPSAGIDSMACYFVDGLLRYIRLSAVMSDISGNIYSDYLGKYFTLSSFPSDLDMLDKLARKMWPDARPDTLLHFVSVKVYDAYKLRAGQLIARSRFAEAYALIRHARLYREKNPWLKNENGTEKLLSDAAAGIYSSYLGIAATSIEYDKFEMAELYIRKALEYRRSNEAWFATDTLYSSVFQKLFRSRLLHCDKMVADGFYREAVDCYTGFENSYGPELIAMVSPWIVSKKDTAWRLLFGRQADLVSYYLKGDQYDSAFQAFEGLTVTLGYLHGDTSEDRRYAEVKATVLPVEFEVYSSRAYQALEGRNYRAAWDLCQLADRVAGETGRLHDSAFCALQRDAYRYHQLEELSLKTGYIWSDRFDSAWYYLDRVKERIETYGLSDDPVLLAAMAAYRDKIYRKQCMNAQEEAEILMIRAARNAELRKYTIAFQQFSTAGAIAEGTPACKMHLPGVKDSIQKYRPPAAYGSGLDTIQHYYTIGNFAKVFSLITSLKELYLAEQLDRFGLNSISLKGYVQEKCNISFTIAAAEMMVVNHRPDEALMFLLLLKEEGQDPAQVSSLQETIGGMLAERDRSKGNLQECKHAVSAYTGSDRWFRELARAYCDYLSMSD